jgi:ABC-type dipeptide/oligopeptide/nickel transport system permease component
MFGYVVRRLLQFIPTILGVTLILFLLLNVLPGTAALTALGENDRGLDL